VARGRVASLLWKTAISGIRGVGMFGPPVVLAGRHSKTDGSLSIFVGRQGAMNPAGRDGNVTR
jgi:hypothetical protein